MSAISTTRLRNKLYNKAMYTRLSSKELFRHPFVFVASDIVIATRHLAAEEAETDVAWVPITELTSRIQDGDIIDADTLASLRLCGY